MLKIFSLFSKNKFSLENNKVAQESILSLRTRMNTLNQKTNNIKEKYPEQQQQIQKCYDQIQQIEPSASVRAGKFEHQIAVAITQVSTELDKIFTLQDSTNLDAQISLLSRTIRERQNADSTTEE